MTKYFSFAIRLLQQCCKAVTPKAGTARRCTSTCDRQAVTKSSPVHKYVIDRQACSQQRLQLLVGTQARDRQGAYCAVRTGRQDVLVGARPT